MALSINRPWAPEWPEEIPVPIALEICCMGAAAGGFDHCTCWVPRFELVQVDDLAVADPTIVRPRCCHDCAYRPDSAEWADPDRREELLDIPNGWSVFWCHQGMQRVVQWEHPAAPGHLIPAGAGDYRPPVADSRAYRADGTPAFVCAGWAARAGADHLTAVLDRLRVGAPA